MKIVGATGLNALWALK